MREPEAYGRNKNHSSMAHAIGYVLSGCSQPLIMTLLKTAGLANSRAQLFMLFYYLGPSLVLLPLLYRGVEWPSTRILWNAIGTALFDIVATSLNYTGASMSGPTIFAIVYSSVTVWTALFSQLVLGRSMNGWQWASVAVVFWGLAITTTDSLQLGDQVVQGLIFVVVGSVMHALTYVLCEVLMTRGDEPLSVLQNCGIQGTTACLLFLLWQLIYTLPRWEETLEIPMADAETTILHGLGLLGLFGFVNWIHSITFYETLVHFPGGATSAGVFKGLQAVIVFVLTHWAFCGRIGGDEMCFSHANLQSLITVVGGVIGYGVATQKREKSVGYDRIQDEVEIESMP